MWSLIAESTKIDLFEENISCVWLGSHLPHLHAQHVDDIKQIGMRGLYLQVVRFDLEQMLKPRDCDHRHKNARWAARWLLGARH